MNNSFKALLGAALLGFIMAGCGSSQYRSGDTCGGDCQKACCSSEEKSCGDDCKKACCSTQACSHPNSTFACSNCTDDKHCCAACATKDAAACPDCVASAKACTGCSDSIKCNSCTA
ncbi:MAG: hypothetical protein AB8C13_01925 [Phycisphaerales bacterium]